MARSALLLIALVCVVLLPALCLAEKVVPSTEHHRVVSPEFGPENVTQHSGTIDSAIAPFRSFTPCLHNDLTHSTKTVGAGYITINGTYANGTHLFFWMFESRSRPSTDPLIVWLTGGTPTHHALVLATHTLIKPPSISPHFVLQAPAALRCSLCSPYVHDRTPSLARSGTSADTCHTVLTLNRSLRVRRKTVPSPWSQTSRSSATPTAGTRSPTSCTSTSPSAPVRRHRPTSPRYTLTRGSSRCLTINWRSPLHRFLLR